MALQAMVDCRSSRNFTRKVVRLVRFRKVRFRHRRRNAKHHHSKTRGTQPRMTVPRRPRNCTKEAALPPGAQYGEPAWLASVSSLRVRAATSSGSQLDTLCAASRPISDQVAEASNQFGPLIHSRLTENQAQASSIPKIQERHYQVIRPASAISTKVALPATNKLLRRRFEDQKTASERPQ